MKRILSLVLTLSMLLSCVLLAEAEAPAKLSICAMWTWKPSFPRSAPITTSWKP